MVMVMFPIVVEPKRYFYFLSPVVKSFFLESSFDPGLLMLTDLLLIMSYTEMADELKEPKSASFSLSSLFAFYLIRVPTDLVDFLPQG